MKIAVAGKGGSGKTTLSATLARLFARQGFPVLAIDGDPNPNLGIALGLAGPALANLHPLPRNIIEEKPDADGINRLTLTKPIQKIAAEYGVQAPDNVTLLMNVQVDHAGKGWLCSAHATVRGMLSQLIEQTNQFTIVDMEASVEHMSRGTVRHVDQMLIVAEPYYRSLEAAARIFPLALDLGIKQVQVVANKVRDARDEEAIRRYCAEHKMDIIGVLPFDEGVLGADQAGRPILEVRPDSLYVKAVEKLAARLQTLVQKEQTGSLSH